MNIDFTNFRGTIIWISPFYNRTGFAVGARAAVTTLNKAGIPVRIISVGNTEPGLDDCDIELLKRLEKTPLKPPLTTIIHHVPSEEWLRFKFPEPNLRILSTAYDCSKPRIPKKWLEICNQMDNVWVHSTPEKNAFIHSGVADEKIHIVPYPHPWKENYLILQPEHETISKNKPFRFLSIAVFQPRRRWDTLVEAYLEEFKNNKNVELYLKVTYPTWHPVPGKPKQELFEIISSARAKTQSNAAIIVDESLGTRKELISLIDQSNVYVSTDASPTAPIAEARTRMRLVVVPNGVLKVANKTIQIEIEVDPKAQAPISEEILQYKHFKRNDLLQKLHTKDVRHALKKAYSLSVEEREKICQTAIRYIPGPSVTTPRIINAINAGWEHKKSQQNDITVKSPEEKKIPERTTENISWEGSFFVHHSLALVNREMVNSLIDRNLNIGLVPYEKNQFKPDANHYLSKLVPLLNKYIDKTDIHVRHHWPPNLEAPKSGHWVIIQPWEFGSLPKEWVSKFQAEVDECWVPSHYVKQVYVESGVDINRVFVIPNGINPEIFHHQVPPTPIGTKKKFKFLFVGGTIHRKGIDILLRVYSETFTNEDDVTLIIKDFGGDAFYQGQTIAEYIKRLQADEKAPEIGYINQTLPENELVGLYTACDVLVHPYRGEGFGLPILEAMACGTPVIVTNGGAALDFCKPDYSLLVNAKKVLQSYNRVGNRELVGNAWFFEPEPADLSAKMIYAYQHPEEMKEKGRQAHQEVHEHWTWADTGKKIAERINVLKDKPLQRESHKADLKLDSTKQVFQSDVEELKKVLQEAPGDIATLKKLTELYIEKGQT